jgi:hypothetical protein
LSSIPFQLVFFADILAEIAIWGKKKVVDGGKNRSESVLHATLEPGLPKQSAWGQQQVSQ